MNMDVHTRRVAQPDLLQVAAEVLVADPRASLGEVAAAAGVGRTTLHKRYPTRDALLLAVAHDSVDRFAEAMAESGIALLAPHATASDATEALRRLVEALVPLGARLEFLLRQPALDADPALAARIEQLDAPVEQFVRRAQRAGAVRREAPVWWVASTLYALTYSAWDGVARGRLAALDAPELAFRTVLAGIGEAP
jgi:AcrR family transcriptional regulator